MIYKDNLQKLLFLTVQTKRFLFMSLDLHHSILNQLASTIHARRQSDPSLSYVAKLLHKGEDAILKKIGEESTEVILASKEGNHEHLIYEIADLWFHTLVLLEQHHLHPDAILNELARREGVSGISEKAARPAP